jgi:hypothetical protein
VVQSQPGQIVPETLSLKNPSLKRLVEWLKIIEKKKKEVRESAPLAMETL